MAAFVAKKATFRISWGGTLASARGPCLKNRGQCHVPGTCVVRALAAASRSRRGGKELRTPYSSVAKPVELAPSRRVGRRVPPEGHGGATPLRWTRPAAGENRPILAASQRARSIGEFVPGRDWQRTSPLRWCNGRSERAAEQSLSHPMIGYPITVAIALGPAIRQDVLGRVEPRGRPTRHDDAAWEWARRRGCQRPIRDRPEA